MPMLNFSFLSIDMIGVILALFVAASSAQNIQVSTVFNGLFCNGTANFITGGSASSGCVAGCTPQPAFEASFDRKCPAAISVSEQWLLYVGG